MVTDPAEDGFMKILAIDSFSCVLSVAVSNAEKIFFKESNTEMKQSEIVMDFIDTLMKDASLKPADLDGVLCMGGPGSFTGLRIGYSIAKGLALSLSIPFAAIPTLDCIAYQITQNSGQRSINNDSRLPTPDSPIILALIEARKNSFFYAFFQNGKRMSADKEADAPEITEEIKKLCACVSSCEPLLYPVLTGPASVVLYENLPSDLKERIILRYKTNGYAKELIHLAKISKILDNDTEAFLYAGPEYIRVTDAEAARNASVK